MKRSAFISDIIFAFFAAFLFTLCLFRYLEIKLIPAILLALLCGALTAASVGSFLQSRRKTFFLKKSDEAQKQKLLLHLAFLSDEGKTQFFLSRLTSEQAPAKRFGKLKIHTADAFYALRFDLTSVNSDDILRFSRLKTGKQKILLCSKIEDAAHALAEKLPIKVLTGDEVYALLKEQNALPETYLGEETAEVKRKRRVRLWLSRANAKRFLIAAILTLISALLSPFPYYYILFGGALLFSALLIRVFGYE